MKKVTLLLTLLLAFTLLFSACAKDDYVQKYLSNEGEYQIERMWAPQSTCSSFLGYQTMLKRIQIEIEPLQMLDFHYAKNISPQGYEEISLGTYGASVNPDELNYDTVFRTEYNDYSNKYVLSLHHADGTVSLVMVDCDGTVYYVNNKDYRLMKTKSGTVDPADFEGAFS